MSAGIWVIHTGPKSGGELVTLFGGYSYDGVSAAIGVQHTEVANLGSVLGEYLPFTQNLTCINALVMFALLLIQICLHMNLYTVAHLCSMNICGMISFGGLLSE